MEALVAARKQALWRDVAAWRKAESLRAYARAVAARFPEEVSWEQWAMAEADLIDPLVVGAGSR